MQRPGRCCSFWLTYGTSMGFSRKSSTLAVGSESPIWRLTSLTIEEYADALLQAVRSGAARHGLTVPRISVEPGRSRPAGVTIYTVGTIKRISGAHIRERGRRNERQPPPRALRFALHHPRGGFGLCVYTDGPGHHSWEALCGRKSPRAGHTAV